MSSSLKGNRVNVMIFPNSASFAAAALVCYLPSSGPSIKSGVHTLTPRENRERPESEIYFKILEKNPIFNEHPVVIGEKRDVLEGKLPVYAHGEI